MGRRPCCEKVGLKKGRWTAEEDDRLRRYILANGEGSWRSLPKNAGLLRCGKSCRLRWINYLRSDLKRGNITTDEEDIIIKLHASIGNRWSLIASHLPGRTDNEIKNYWNSHLSRQIHTFRRRTNNEAGPVIIDVARLTLPPRRKAGRSRKSKDQSFPPEVKELPETTQAEEHLGQTSEISSPPTPDLERETREAVNDPADGSCEEREKVEVEVDDESYKSEGRHDADADGGVQSYNYNELLDDESLDLDGLLTYVEWDETKSQSDANAMIEEREECCGGTCENKNSAGTDELLADCNSITSFHLDSPWDWESFAGGHRIWESDADLETAGQAVESDAVISWLLS